MHQWDFLVHHGIEQDISYLSAVVCMISIAFMYSGFLMDSEGLMYRLPFINAIKIFFVLFIFIPSFLFISFGQFFTGRNRTVNYLCGFLKKHVLSMARQQSSDMVECRMSGVLYSAGNSGAIMFLLSYFYLFHVLCGCSRILRKTISVPLASSRYRLM